uniref:Ig-like domain-containing protein n=1 Tax=Seriola dumerili TaxID=41447 RepID=A0A3B4TEB2_SERDU
PLKHNFYQLSPAAVTSGETARFTVKVSGFPKPTVQWSHNGTILKTSSMYKLIEEREEYTLVITKVTSEVEGEYSLKKPDVSQAEKWVEKMFKVTGQPPTFTVQIQPVRCSEGGEVYFNYKANGDPIPDVKWFKGAFQIQPSRNCIIIANPDGSGFINMKSVKQEDSGLYTCKASNPFGEASCGAELVVFRESVSVSHKQEQMTVVQKKGYKLRDALQSAVASDQPVLLADVVGRLQAVEVQEVKPEFKDNSATLRIIRLEKADSGVYKCRATNSAGFKETSSTLYVKGYERLPYVVFLCCHIYWFKEGSEISPSDRYKMAFVNSVATLEVCGADTKDSGIYYCEARNEAGSESCSMELKVKG